MHGDDGMGDLDWPGSTAGPTRGTRSSCSATCCWPRPEPVTLVPLAPMTNIALLLRTYPEVARGIERIVFMGGAAQVGNATAVGGVQRLARPGGRRDRARRLRDLGIPVTMYGLDVFYGPG